MTTKVAKTDAGKGTPAAKAGFDGCSTLLTSKEAGEQQPIWAGFGGAEHLAGCSPTDEFSRLG